MLWKRVIKAENIHKIPLLTRIKVNLKGFTADQYVRFDFKNNDMNGYLSELDRWKSRELNGPYNIIFDDKILFYEVFSKHLSIPRNLAWVNNAQLYDLKGGTYSKEQLLFLLDMYKKLIVKPAYLGGSGKGVSLLSSEDGVYKINSESVSPEYITEYILNNNNTLICEYIMQHEYSNKLYDKTANTIRIITIFNEEYTESRVLVAIQRIGTKETIPVDNASKGALVSLIDLETGVLGEAKTMFDSTSHRCHPNTGNRIAGIQVPFWQKVKDTLLHTHEKFPYIKLIAWDVMIHGDGFSVIEGNASTGFNIFQLWTGARDSELGLFYKKNDIIK